MKKPFRWSKCFLFPLVGLAFLALFSAIVMVLWNHVLVDVTGVRAVNYGQAVGILVLAKILFGGCRGRGRFGPSWWRQRRMWRERWHALNPEEREKFRTEMRERFGTWPRPECCGWDEGEENAGEAAGGPGPAKPAG